MPTLTEKQTYYSVIINGEIHDVTGRKRTPAGYVALCIRSHPNSDKGNGYVFEHRVVMEMKLGRYLNKNEVVHHLNEVKHDNRLENLMIMGNADHTIMHHTGAKRNKKTRDLLSKKAQERWGTPHIPKEQLIELIDSNLPLRRIFKNLGIHQNTFYKKVRESGLESYYQEKRSKKKSC